MRMQEDLLLIKGSTESKVQDQAQTLSLKAKKLSDSPRKSQPDVNHADIDQTPSIVLLVREERTSKGNDTDRARYN